jgi:pleiotropic regulator 1
MPRPAPGSTVAAAQNFAQGPLLLTDAASPAGSLRGAGISSSSGPAASASAAAPTSTAIVVSSGAAAAVQDVADAIARRQQPRGVADDSLEAFKRAEELAAKAQAQSRAIVSRRAAAPVPEPKWHAPWTLMRVISGHLGWVRAIAFDPGNEWFVTGGADRTIK